MPSPIGPAFESPARSPAKPRARLKKAIRRTARELCPPILVRWYRQRRGNVSWTGDYPSWEAAGALASDYQQESILDRVRRSALQVKAGNGAFERDSMVFATPEYNWSLLGVLLHAAAANGGRLRVLDFGGSLGSVYQQHRVWLDALPHVQWIVVEQEHFVRCGRAQFEDDRLCFCASIAEATASGQPDVVLLSGVLGYLREPHSILAQAAAIAADYLVIDRTGFTHNDRDRITIQQVPRFIYEATYPCRFFSRSDIAKTLSRFDLLTTFPAVDEPPSFAEFLGLIFRRKRASQRSAPCASTADETPPTVEHFVTAFDHRFALQGMALHESLQQHRSNSVLWIVCLDEAVHELLEKLQLTAVRLITLPEMETPELLEAKANRNWAEYIYTLTPFLFSAVFSRDASARRVTYVDADLYFFRNPETLLPTKGHSAAKILLTEHGFPPKLQWLASEFGRFCVQFLTLPRDARCLEIVRSWQLQCIASCSTDTALRSAVYGEQKYLDAWPDRYPGCIHIHPHARETLAPWNVDHEQTRGSEYYWPVFYHFHSLRIFRPGWVQLYANFRLRHADHLYRAYLEALQRQDAKLAAAGIPQPVVPFNGDRFWLLRLAWRCARRRGDVRRLSRNATESIPAG